MATSVRIGRKRRGAGAVKTRLNQQALTVRRPLRIGLVISSLRVGGAERVASILATIWSEQRIEVTLLTAYPQETDFYRAPETVRRLTWGYIRETKSQSRRIAGHVRCLARLRRAIRKARPDILVSFGDTTNLMTLMSRAGLRVPVIISERTDPRLAPCSWLTRRFRPWLYRFASSIVVQSQAVRKWAQCAVPGGAVRVIPNPLLPAAPPCGKSRLRRVVGVGRLVPEKGFELLIRAFARCIANYPEWKLAIFGDGPERLALQSLVARLGIAGSVQFGGLVRETEAELAASEIFALSSRFEGFPNVLLEAMSCGTPVVSFDCPSGPSEIIRDGFDGLIVPPGDVNLLSAALARLMSDSALRTELGSNARRTVERYSAEKISAMWSDLFAEIIPSHSFAHR